mgnify:CR=1 FL=1
MCNLGGEEIPEEGDDDPRTAKQGQGNTGKQNPLEGPLPRRRVPGRCGQLSDADQKRDQAYDSTDCRDRAGNTLDCRHKGLFDGRLERPDRLSHVWHRPGRLDGESPAAIRLDRNAGRVRRICRDDVKNCCV